MIKIRIDELKKQIEILKMKHENDPDLAHELGSDSDCLYCDRYKKLIVEQKKLGISMKPKPKPKPTFIVTSKNKELYEVITDNGSKYMVYAKSLEEVAKLLKISVSAIRSKTTIQKKYWDGLFVESERGNVVTVKQLMTSQRSRIIASYLLSTNKNVRHYCYNDTPIEYLLYETDHYELLERFVKPYEIIRTKKFKSTGRVTVYTPHGSIGVSPSEVLLKITKTKIVVISEEEFLENFSKAENYAWSVPL